MKRILTSLLLAAVLVCSFVMPTGASGLSSSNFTPSVTAKTVPEIVPYVKGDVEYAATLVRINDDGTETVIGDIAFEDISHIAYASISEEHVDVTAAEQMMAAYDEISGAQNFADLCPGLEDVVKEMGSEYSTERLVASDLFEFSLLQLDTAAILKADEGVVLRVTFRFNLAEGECAPVVMHRDSITGKWQVVPYDSVNISAEDQITVEFPSLCPIVFLRASAGDVPAPFSFGNILFIVGFVILAFLLILLIRALVVAVKRSKRRSAIIESEGGFLEGYYRLVEGRNGPQLIHQSGISIERINRDDD